MTANNPDMQMGGIGKSSMGQRMGLQTGDRTQLRGVRKQAIFRDPD